MTAATADATPQQKGHPFGLYILFGTEMWERFNYYGMRALLVLYLINELRWQPEQSSSVYKWFTSLVYLTPLLGGFLADRVIGLRWSILAGALLMALGQFSLAFGGLPLFYAALGLIIVGNGFFKPNISTLVGRMYHKVDARRDGAFTIFYMGINLGAFFAPLVCGGLRRHFGFQWGFAAAGFGMLAGMTIFLLGLPRIAKDVAAVGNTMGLASAAAPEPTPKTEGAHYRDSAMKTELTDDEKPRATGFAHAVSAALPILMLVVAVLLPGWLVIQLVRGQAKIVSLFMPFAFCAIAGWMGVTLLRIKGAARDKSTVIFALFFFVVLFWMAFEQAGNTLNIWADVNTKPGFMEAEDYQSVNPLFIILFGLGTIVASYIGTSKSRFSTPFKMFGAMILMALSFGVMVAAGAGENATESRAPLATIPPRVLDAMKHQNVELEKENGLNTGRLSYDEAKHELVVRGVLPEYTVSALLEATADGAFSGAVDLASDGAKKGNVAMVDVPQGWQLPEGQTPEAFSKRLADKGVAYDAPAKTLRISKPLDAGTRAEIVGGSAPPEWIGALREIRKQSLSARVSGWWLILSYFLATVGELLLSPVGLSMVTKLAPARFASLFMGVWMLASSVAQYAGGSIGELWTKMTPTTYFEVFVGSSLVAAAVLAMLVVPLRRLMHDAA